MEIETMINMDSQRTYKTMSYKRKANINYYYRHRNEEEFKKKNRERYIEKKKHEYIEKHGSLDGFIIPQKYEKHNT